MSDDPAAGGTQAVADQQPQAGTPGPQAGTDSTSGEPTSDGDSLSIEEARKLRSENASLRRRLKDTEAAQAQAQQATLTDQQKTEGRISELERQLADQSREAQESRVQAAVVDAASRAGFTNPGLAYRIIDTAALDFDDQHRPTNVDQLVAGLAKAEPYLLKAGAGSGSGDLGQGGGQPARRTYSRAELRDTAFYEANRDDIQAAYREGRITG